jgi:SAM-dependent methyltransferase
VWSGAFVESAPRDIGPDTYPTYRPAPSFHEGVRFRWSSCRLRLRKCQVKLLSSSVQADYRWSRSMIGHVLFGAVHDGTVTLLLPSNRTLARAIQFIGGRCVEAGGVGEPLHVPGEKPDEFHRWSLPFDDATFDSVFLDSQAILQHVQSFSGQPVASLRRLVEECGRVLKPGGRVVFTCPNRYSLWRLFQRSNNRQAGEKPRLPALTRSGYKRLLNGLGFSVAAEYIPWPTAADLRRFIRLDAPAEEMDFSLEGNRLKQRVGRVMFALLNRLGSAADFVDAYCFVAVKRAGDAPPVGPAGTLEIIADLTCDDARSIKDLEFRGGSNSLVFHTQTHFFKVPLSPTSTTLLQTDAKMVAFVAARDSCLRDLTLRTELLSTAGVQFASLPYIQVGETHGKDESRERFRFLLDRLSTNSEVVLLHETDMWQRLVAKDTIHDFSSLGAADLLTDALQRVAMRSVPAGVVHGDLTESNVIRDSRDGRLLLIDWTLGERRSPKFLDPVRVCADLARKHCASHNPKQSKSEQVLDAWRLLIARAPSVPFYQYIEAASGDLDWKETLGIAFLDRVSRDLWVLRSNSKSKFRSGVESMLRKRIALVRVCLQGKTGGMSVT